MDKVTIERHSEKHYTIRGNSLHGPEVIEYICSGYINQKELYDKVERKEATDLIVLCRLSNESQEDLHNRLREEAFGRASALMANTLVDSPLYLQSDRII